MNSNQSIMKLSENIILQSWIYLWEEWNRFPTETELKNIITQFVNNYSILKVISTETKNLFINAIFNFMWGYINSERFLNEINSNFKK